MEFDKRKWKVYNSKNWVVIHWIINPGIVINELILGQRIPKISVEDKESNKPRIERTYIPCPHCEKMHDARTWSPQNNTGFKNWFGLYCNNCGNIIPCVTNVFSLIVLIVTFPVWGWFKKSMKDKWIEKQPERYASIELNEFANPYEGYGWIKQGLFFGTFMYVFIALVIPLVSNKEISSQDLLIEIPIWLIGGLAFGYIMRLFSNKKGNTTVTNN